MKTASNTFFCISFLLSFFLEARSTKTPPSVKRHFYRPQKITFADIQHAVTPYKKADIQLYLPHLSLNKARAIGHEYRSIIKINQELWRSLKRSELIPISEYLPQVRFSMSASNNRADVLPTKQLDVIITQLLYQGNGPIQKYKIAVHESEISWWQVALIKDQVQSQVEQSYLSLWRTQQEERSIYFLHQAATHEFDQGWNVNNVGLLAKPEWEQEHARYASALSIINGYQDRKKLDHDKLKFFVGKKIDESLAVKSTLEFLANNLSSAQKYDLPFYLKNAFKLRKELRINEQEILKEQRKRDLFAQSYLPTIFVQTNITNTFFRRGSTPSGTFWQIALRLDWQFDGLGNAHRARANDAIVLAKMIERINTQNIITVEVQTAYHTVQGQLKELQAAQAQLKQQQAQYERAVVQHDIGEINGVAFSRAQETWEQAQFDVMNLTVKTVQNYRDLLFKAGYPDNL